MLEVWKWGLNACYSNDEPLEDVDCFKFLGSQVAAEESCERDVVHRINETNRAWGSLKSVLSKRGLGIKGQEVSI